MPNLHNSIKQTVTVGIPALNEERTIEQLISSIFRQEQSNYSLEKVVIVTDGSTDRTPAIVKRLQSTYLSIELIEHKNRAGKAQRLNEIYRHNRSDILVTFDADILIDDPQTIAKMVAEFSKADVVLVSANDKPFTARSFAQRIVNTWYGMWRFIVNDLKKGDNIYNVHGNASALSREFATSVAYPKNITADQDYLYLSAIKQQKRYSFAKHAIVFFHTPETLSEFSFQTSRFLNEKVAVVPMFNELVEVEYQIPLLFKLERIALYIAENPIYFILAACVYAYILFFYKKRDPLNKSGLWSEIASTKKDFTKN